MNIRFTIINGLGKETEHMTLIYFRTNDGGFSFFLSVDNNKVFSLIFLGRWRNQLLSPCRTTTMFSPWSSLLSKSRCLSESKRPRPCQGIVYPFLRQ